MIKLTKEQREVLVSEVQHYYEVERSETIGELASADILEFMLKTIGPYVYNQALEDARKMLNDRFAAVEDELYAMHKRPLR
ncbi:DUF2164 domain-containing protein [Paenibacillus sp. UMB4589-SE434]|nr:DUF2164 domain-containing protein [Paenibacillus sp. UMB4589-SE434]